MIIAVRIAYRLISVILALIVTTVAVISVLSALSVVRMHHEIGSSMVPTIESGDLVLYRPVTGSQLAAGDIIGFRWPGSDIPITHRIVTASRSGDVVTVTTKGDASSALDRDPAILGASKPIWRVVAVVPNLGPLVAGVTSSGVPLVAGLVPLFLGLPWIEKQLRSKAQAAQERAEGLQEEVAEDSSGDVPVPVPDPGLR